MAPSRSDRDVVAGWAEGISGSVLRIDRLIHVEHVWGTVITINVAGAAGREDEGRAVIDQCTRYFGEVDRTFSTYKPLSEVALHRAGLEGPQPHTVEFAEVMSACRELRSLTLGAFDPWSVPGGYDPSGYVKGWAAGRASDLLTEAGFGDHLVNAGGDVCARGDEHARSGQGWPVGIVNPHEPSEVIEVVHLHDQAMATSGRYERGDHVVDPSTGASAVGVDSATVVGPDSGRADALASAALVHGTASVGWFSALGPEWSLHLVLGETVHTFGPAFESSSTT